eukprot:m.182085 g.182085  ORF g.182085 m.182085 type:complete len:213 (+) comp16639_c3_seq1:339-977(+)
MGGLQSQFLQKNLTIYQDHTYLSRSEIIHVHRLYLKCGGADNGEDKLPIPQILDLPQLKQNPFKQRICKVFAAGDASGMTFVEFLDMFSIFSDNAPVEEKIIYAFKIYDFNDDDIIDKADLFEVVTRLCGLKDDNEELFQDSGDIQPLEAADEDLVGSTGNRRVVELSEVESIIKHILKDADLDGDGCISFDEFRNVVSRSHTFIESFRMRL